MKNAKERTYVEYEADLKEWKQFCYDFSLKWQDLGLSAFVLPTFPHCAFKSADADDMGLLMDYIFMWNILSYPSGALPVTRV